MKITINLCWVILVTATSCGGPERYEKYYQSKGRVQSQLMWLSREIAISLLETNGTDVLNAIIARIREEKGLDFFRSPLDTNVWIRINADIEKWTNSTGSFEIAVYNPEVIYDPERKIEVMIGIDFSGKPTGLKKPPDWRPLPLSGPRRDSGVQRLENGLSASGFQRVGKHTWQLPDTSTNKVQAKIQADR